jgi:hypothetical protein
MRVRLLLRIRQESGDSMPFLLCVTHSNPIEMRLIHGPRSLLLEQLHREPWIRSQALARRGQAPQQHGRGGVQAHRAWPHLPQVISDSFEEKHAQLTKEPGADPEDPDEYKAENVFWVPPAARWSYLQNSAKQPTIGKIVDDAMVAIERDNPRLKGVLPKDYARPGLDKHRLGELIDLIGTIILIDSAPTPIPGSARDSRAVIGDPADQPSPADLPLAAETPSEPYNNKNNSHRSKDILGRVYEYFLGQFASAEGKKGGQFYTPQSVVRLLVEMLAPYKGRIYDPCCGSGGMFVQSGGNCFCCYRTTPGPASTSTAWANSSTSSERSS